MNSLYCSSLSSYQRRKTHTVQIGDVKMGSDFPIRVQSMTTVDTMDTLGSVEQCIRMIESGCELIRITAPSVKEAQNLEQIRKELRTRGFTVPLVADIHFTPNAAELAARIVEKVRINPGNYADKKRFEIIDYTEAAYQEELDRIRDRFLPLVKICKEYGTAMRIGTNHGSLSDRILSKYGDTPVGMVESALEFLRICEDEKYDNIVISMKSSNPQVMVQAYRLLVKRLEEEKLKAYPLHLGVTEAGEGEDGRIKSAMGIGTLLEDGLGDTVRVSLTEDPEFEAPVARALIDRYMHRAEQQRPIHLPSSNLINPFSYQRRKTIEVANFGGIQVPRVIADFSQVPVNETDAIKPVGYFYMPLLDKWRSNDLACDYIYTGQYPALFMLPNGLREIIDYSVWHELEAQEFIYPLLTSALFFNAPKLHPQLNFLLLTDEELTVELAEKLKDKTNIVVWLESSNPHAMPALRAAFMRLLEVECRVPVVIKRKYNALSDSDLQLFSSTDAGGLLVDGLGDGIVLSMDNSSADSLKMLNSTSFGILQAARTRMSKTEYISCPSCGRTLFDLQETTAMIRKRTDHLKGVKIGIMGCIVNGPGEMADADYGYVGMGKDKIALYRGQTVVKRSVHTDKAVDELIQLIQEDGRWFEPEVVEENEK